MGDFMDGSTLQKLSSAILRSYIRHREKYVNRKQLWIHGDFKGKSMFE